MRPNAKRPRVRLRLALTAACSFLACGPATAQSTLSREFERVFFARQEMWVEQLFAAADPERRTKAVPLLAEALLMRGFADSLATERCRLLAQAAAVLAGFAPDDSLFLQRFNFFLLALPEVVDLEKIERDRVLLGEITRKIYPLLRPVEVEDENAPSKDRDRIFLTARGVFGFDKPDGLRLRFSVRPGGAPEDPERDAAAEGAQVAVRGDDTEDPSGWRVFKLVQSFAVAKPGPWHASVEIGSANDWPRRGDPPCASRFHVAPGYHRDFFELLALREKLAARTAEPAPEGSAEPAPEGTELPRRIDLDRLEVLSAEALRPLLGREFVVRSWPVTALREATLLARELVAGQRPKVPERGDRTYGIGLDDGRVLPLRVVWGKHAQPARAVMIFAPACHDENWVIDGLGITVEELQADGRVWVFTPFPTAPEFLPRTQRLLAEELGIASEHMALVGALDGSTRASYAIAGLGAKIDTLVLIGREVPRPDVLESKNVAHVRVVPVYGRPAQAELDALRERARAARVEPSRLFVVGVGPRSMTEAFRLLLGKPDK